MYIEIMSARRLQKKGMANLAQLAKPEYWIIPLGSGCLAGKKDITSQANSFGHVRVLLNISMIFLDLLYFFMRSTVIRCQRHGKYVASSSGQR